MRTWRPKPGLALLVAFVLLGAVLTGLFFLSLHLLVLFMQPFEQWPINLIHFGEFAALVALFVFAGVLLYRILSALTLAYRVDRNALMISWLGNQLIVPMQSITTIDSGSPGGYGSRSPLRRLAASWGRGRTAEGDLLYLYTTRSVANSLIIRTPAGAYAISPGDPAGFVQEFEQRRRLGATKTVERKLERSRIFFYAFWDNRVIRYAMLTAFLLNLLLFGLLSAYYPPPGASVPIRYDSAGEIANLGERYQLLSLPLVALGLSLLNLGLGLLIFRRSPTGAQLLQVGSVVVQVLFGVALLAALLLPTTTVIAPS